MELDGHLSDYSLTGLFEILHRRRETGCLNVDYPSSPATFYFKNGQLLEARVDVLSGVQAVQVALSLPDASFRFVSSAHPRLDVIVDPLQRFMLDALMPFGKDAAGDMVAHDERAPGTETTISTVNRTTPGSGRRGDAPAAGRAFLSPSPASGRTPFRVGRGVIVTGLLAASLMCVAAAVLFTRQSKAREVATLSPLPSLTRTPALASSDVVSEANAATPVIEGLTGFEVAPSSPPDGEASAENLFTGARPGLERNRLRPATRKAPTNVAPGAAGFVSPKEANNAENPKRRDAPAPDAQTVTVVMLIENGRVSQASVAAHRPGMEAYAASALRVARGRRFPAGTEGRHTVQIKVNRQN